MSVSFCSSAGSIDAPNKGIFNSYCLNMDCPSKFRDLTVRSSMQPSLEINGSGGLLLQWINVLMDLHQNWLLESGGIYRIWGISGRTQSLSICLQPLLLPSSSPTPLLPGCQESEQPPLTVKPPLFNFSPNQWSQWNFHHWETKNFPTDIDFFLRNFTTMSKG